MVSSGEEPASVANVPPARCCVGELVFPASSFLVRSGEGTIPGVDVWRNGKVADAEWPVFCWADGSWDEFGAEAAPDARLSVSRLPRFPYVGRQWVETNARSETDGVQIQKRRN